MTPQQLWAKERLEYLRAELRAGRISYGELAELQGLVKFIDPEDVELLEAAGVPELEAELNAKVAAVRDKIIAALGQPDEVEDPDGTYVDAYGDRWLRYGDVWVNIYHYDTTEMAAGDGRN